MEGREEGKRIKGPHFVEGREKAKKSGPRGQEPRGRPAGGRCGPMATTTVL